MAEKRASEIGGDEIRVWLDRAADHSPKCFICKCIADANRPFEGRIKPLKISGIEMSAETQVAHLDRCVGQAGREA